MIGAAAPHVPRKTGGRHVHHLLKLPVSAAAHPEVGEKHSLKAIEPLFYYFRLHDPTTIKVNASVRRRSQKARRKCSGDAVRDSEGEKNA